MLAARHISSKCNSLHHDSEQRLQMYCSAKRIEFSCGSRTPHKFLSLPGIRYTASRAFDRYRRCSLEYKGYSG